MVIRNMKIKKIFVIKNKIKNPVYLNINSILKENSINLNIKKDYYIKIIVSSEKTPARLKFGYNISNKQKFDFPSNVCFNAVVPNASMLKKKKTFKWAPIINKKTQK